MLHADNQPLLGQEKSNGDSELTKLQDELKAVQSTISRLNNEAKDSSYSMSYSAYQKLQSELAIKKREEWKLQNDLERKLQNDLIQKQKTGGAKFKFESKDTHLDSKDALKDRIQEIEAQYGEHQKQLREQSKTDMENKILGTEGHKAIAEIEEKIKRES